jgi:hypothetical protein
MRLKAALKISHCDHSNAHFAPLGCGNSLLASDRQLANLASHRLLSVSPPKIAGQEHAMKMSSAIDVTGSKKN